MSTNQDKIKEYLRGIVINLPECPGVYQYLNDKEKIIYIGKAKNLKRRVTSYFNKEQSSYKTKILVTKIRDIKYIIVNTEEDALLLENNLIKKYKPHYNVLLKDDKTYPSLYVTNEPYPRVIKTRHITKDGGTYYGPYSHVPTLYALLKLIKHLYKLRSCRLDLTKENIAKAKYKVCLEYHIGNCLAPCIGKQTYEDYQENIKDIKRLLNGETQELSKALYSKMQELSSKLKFEEAEEIKRKYFILENYRAKSEVVNPSLHNIDVFTIEEEENHAYINYLHITNGAINQAFTFEYKKKINETEEELLALGIAEMRERYKSQAKEIIIPFPIDLELGNIHFTIPQKGDKKKLLDLSESNVKQYKLDRLKQAEKLNPEQRSVRLMKEIKDLLHLKKLPINIECFDNSNIQGSDAVAVCIVFKKLKPSKKDYRKYNIKTVVGPDDYASMKEVVRRRYTRLLKENATLPDLIITDGGAGQMSIVNDIVKEELNLNIPIAGLAKNNKHRTSKLLFGIPPKEIDIKQTSSMFKVLVNIQDEVHRFAITFHRNKRSKRQIESELDHIKGIGEKTKTELLNKYKSIKRIKETNDAELKTLIGAAKTKILKDNLQ